jgi:predicted GH43/DUF377 family glycosyl hydrolase
MKASVFATWLLAVAAFLSTGSGLKAQVLAPQIGVYSMQQMPVMTPSPAPAWDSIDVANPAIFPWQGQLVDYYSGWNGSLWQTGVAVSSDGGVSWTKMGNPVLSPGSGGWATQYIAANGSAIIFNGQVYYYFHGLDANGVTKIGLATAQTAHMLTMTALANPVVSPGPPGAYDDLGVADPYVIKVGSQLWMYYLAYNHNYVFTIARAVSNDGVNWTKDPAGEIFSGTGSDYDAAGAGEPCVFYSQGYWYMIYTGNTSTSYRSLMWAWSYDGQHWTKGGLLMPQNMRPTWASQAMADAMVVPSGKDDGMFYLWYLGGNVAQSSQGMNGQIGMMTIHVTGNGP